MLRERQRLKDLRRIELNTHIAREHAQRREHEMRCQEAASFVWDDENEDDSKVNSVTKRTSINNSTTLSQAMLDTAGIKRYRVGWNFFVSKFMQAGQNQRRIHGILDGGDSSIVVGNQIHTSEMETKTNERSVVDLLKVTFEKIFAKTQSQQQVVEEEDDGNNAQQRTKPEQYVNTLGGNLHPVVD